MQLKIDTKERFQVITIQEDFLTATLSAALRQKLLPYLQNDANSDITGNIVLVMDQVGKMDEEAADLLAALQQEFYDKGKSFVICGLQPSVEQFLDTLSLLEMMNVTPTESEAWDIVQMEEIERELLGDDTEEN